MIFEQLIDDVEEVPIDYPNEVPYLLCLNISFGLFCHLMFANLL